MSTRLSRGQFGRGIEGPAQLVVDGEGVIFVRKAQILRSFVPYRAEIELSSPAQYLHFLAGQRCFNAAGETGVNGEELVFPVQLEAGRDGGCEKLLAQPLEKPTSRQLGWAVPPSCRSDRGSPSSCGKPVRRSRCRWTWRSAT
jgi:hypothetical protein